MGMIIDAHAAGDYATAESIIATSKKYGIDKVVLCTSPKNNLDLKAPPNIPFMKSPSSIYLLNRMLRLAYKSFNDYGDGNKYVSEIKHKIPELVIPFLWMISKETLKTTRQGVSNFTRPGIRLP